MNLCSNNTYKDDLRLVRGNDFATVHDIIAKYPDKTLVEGFDLNLCTDITIRIKRDNGFSKDVETYAESWSIIEPKKIRINFDGLKMKNGSYRVDFSGKFQDKDWRCFSIEKGFGIVESNEEANIPADTIIAEGVYAIYTDFLMTYQTQEQADWEEEDNLLPSYIKNKPDLSEYVEKVEGKDLSDNNYSDEEKQKVDNAVPNTREINGKALDSDIILTASDIDALPTSTKYGYSIDISLNNQDYKLTASLKDQDGTLLNSKVVDFPLETVVVSGRYDPTNKAIVLTLKNGNRIDIPVGDLVSGLQSQITPSSKLDSDLVRDINSFNKFVTVSDKATWNAKQDELESGVNIKTINNQSILGSGNITIEGGGGSSTLAGLSDVSVSGATSGQVLTYDGSVWEAQTPSGGGGEANVIESVSVNGTAQTVTNKNVDITVPTAVSDLDNDSGFITTETDPTVPSWAKASSKPSYTASEVGAVPTTRTVNGKALSADITLSASDVSALPSSTVIPDAQIQSDWNQSDTDAKDYIKNKPTIPSVPVTDVTVGGVSVVSSGTAVVPAIPTVPTISTNITTDANDDTKTASPKAVKTYADSVAGDTNVIETVKVNGVALVPDAYKAVDVCILAPISEHGTSDTTFALTPNVWHKWGTVSALTLTLATPTDNTVVNMYMFEFTSGSTAATLSLPNTVVWDDDNAPTIATNTRYEITIQNNGAAFKSFKTA